ncbi:MAG TPA: hypothetical protein VER37_10950, partial [Thermomicrobiales bacterium]|nr:hypothetical protein [Thermomicrobiales bacterium]
MVGGDVDEASPSEVAVVAAGSVAVPTPQPWFGVMRWGAILLALIGALLVGAALVRHVEGSARLSLGFADHDRAPVVVGGVLLVLGGSAVAYRPELGILRRQILTSAAWAIALLSGIVLLWALIDSSDVRDDWVGTPVFDSGQVDRLVQERFSSAAEAFRIPTGVQLQSAE